jgi:choline dehydrogenase
MTTSTPQSNQYEYIVVGSGAGGGPLAARLAEKGHTVLLLEAGDDPSDRPSYQVPAFHGLATEDPAMKSDYYVHHYTKPEKGQEPEKEQATEQEASKYDPEKKAIWYPRASALGGCAAHNALVTVYPHNSDWDHIADITDDPTWKSDNMRMYFERLERCEYPQRPEAGGPNSARRGFDGWLSISPADPFRALGRDQDRELLQQIAIAAVETLLKRVRNPTALASLLMAKVGIDAEAALGILKLLLEEKPDLHRVANNLVEKTPDFLQKLFDPNDWEFVKNSMEGLCIVPLAVTSKGIRNSPREFIRATPQNLKDTKSKGGLEVWTNVVVTQVLFEKNDRSNTAIGVKYVPRQDFRAAAPGSGAQLPEKEVRARREVILCAGTFNTPKLLMLSGIGPKKDLQKTLGNDYHVRVNLPGVGQNLQDHYEVGIISELKTPIDLDLKLPESGEVDAAALANNSHLKIWKEEGKGPYATNGAVLSIILRSKRVRPEPDLFILALPGCYKGYFQRCSELLEKGKGQFIWSILKAHTRNRAGTVTLCSKDPRDAPAINFDYFGDDDDRVDEDARDDLDSLVEGVEFVQRMSRRIGSIKRIILPGVAEDTKLSEEVIREFIRKKAWGHHACGTCRMGPRTSDRMVPHGDPGAVVDSDFRVYGTRNLRIVDASVFPRIPGFFIVTPIYMISEKASDVIHLDALRASSPK